MSNIILSSQKKYLKEFKSEKDPLILEMEEFAKENKIPILHWDSSAFMEQLIKIKEPAKVLEIGTAIGYSTIKIARNLKGKNSIDTIEISKENAKTAKVFIEKSGLENKINLIMGNALRVLPQIKKKYDFIFLDADKEDYKKLFHYSLVLLKKGGVMFVDNLLWHGYAASKHVPKNYKSSTRHIREFNKIFSSQVNLQTTILPIGDGIGLGIKL